MIHDNRLLDLLLKGKLGFGYDEASNGLFTSCLDFESASERSYNLSSNSYAMNENINLSAVLGPSPYRHELLKFINESKHKEQEWDPELDRQVNLKKILFSVKMHSQQYIPSNSFRLNPLSRMLLEQQDWESFFRLCGTSFIHSYTKGAHYIAVLSYRSLGDGDEYFLERLMQNIHRLYEPQLDDPDFEQQLKRRRLRAMDLSLGLPEHHERRESLNLEGFRKKLLLVNTLLTQESAGLVNSIEINPWHEFSEFLEHLPWDNQTNWAQISKLAQNGRFISAMHLKEKQILSRLKKAQLCRSKLINDFPVGQGPGENNPNRTFFMNLNWPSQANNISLKEFQRRLIEENLEGQIKMHHQIFRSGSEETQTEGLDKCLQALDDSFLTTFYGNISACVKAEVLPDLERKLIEAYCLPQLADTNQGPTY